MFGFEHFQAAFFRGALNLVYEDQLRLLKTASGMHHSVIKTTR